MIAREVVVPKGVNISTTNTRTNSPQGGLGEAELEAQGRNPRIVGDDKLIEGGDGLPVGLSPLGRNAEDAGLCGVGWGISVEAGKVCRVGDG